MAVTRFGVSLDEDILEELDRYVVDNDLPNRSQAIRHLVEKNLAEKKWLCNQVVAGAVVLLYDQSKKETAARLREIQNQNNDLVLSSQYFLLENNKCLEIIAVKGKAQKLTKLSDKLIGVKGIIHGKLIMSRVE